MEDKNPKSDDDSVIMIENIPETIPVPSGSEKKKKLKKRKLKKRKRTVKLELDHSTAMENLLITQRMQVKRAKFRCFININTVCKEQKSDSIIRFSKNEWKKEAYYDRIVPICSRDKCFTDSNMNHIFKSSCCRRAWNKDNTAITNPGKRDGMFSPVSSIPLTEALENISYEEVSNGDLSSSEEELDTLIKRTKEREKLFDPLSVFSAPVTSTPIHELASTSDLSLHSLATLVLTPLKTEAYSPTMTPDFIKMENQYPPVPSPYSPSNPTETPPKYYMGLEKDGRVISPCSQASRRLKFEIDDENCNRILELVKKEKTDTNGAIKSEEIAVKSERKS